MKLLTLALLLSSFSNYLFSQTSYPGQGIIGKGYNVFGEYASNKSIERYKIFNFSKMTTEMNQFGQNTPLLISIENISDHIITTVEGSSIQEYSKQLSQNVGLGGEALFFKASIDNHLNDSYKNGEKLFYYTYMDINTKWRISLDLRNLDKVIEYLDEQFKTDLANLAPEELFELYGTHFISSAYLGGRIDYLTTSTLSKSITTNELKEAISAQYKVISGNYSMDERFKSVLTNSKTSTRLNVVGGNSEYTNNIKNSEQYQKWASGISTDPVLCGFDKKSLVPIWNLTKDVDRKKELENYFNNTILSKYPYPVFFKEDEILDSKDFTSKFDVYILGFDILGDCDHASLLESDNSGDFRYRITIKQDEKLVNEYITPENKYHAVWGGEFLAINQKTTITMPLKKNSSIDIDYKLIELDDFTDHELVGYGSKKHFFPFSEHDLYNNTYKNVKVWSQQLYHSDGCRAQLIYNISPSSNQTAIDFGSKGWEEYSAGNYDECLNYSRKALEIDNSLWFVQYNVALIYLIQENPRAFEKYKLISEYCNISDIFQAAYNDIINHEKKFGILKNSEPIKVLLKSRFN